MSELDLKDLLERAEVLTRAIDADWSHGAVSTHSTDYWQQCIVPITRKIPAVVALVAELEGQVDDLTSQVAGRDETIQRVRDRHGPLKIYTECGHDEEDEDCTGEIVEIEEFGWTCQDGYMYSICRECCAPNGEQTEECAASHDHTKGGPLCSTRKDIDGDRAPLDQEEGDDG